MPALNKVLLMGNLTRDPELRVTPKGTPICQFALAINRQFKMESGEIGRAHVLNSSHRLLSRMPSSA